MIQNTCRLLKVFLMFVVCTVCISCTHSNVSVTNSPSVDSDSSYHKELYRVTRQAAVSDKFDSKYKIYVTYISSEFKQALNNRYQSLYDKALNLFPEEGVSFLVSLYTNDSTKSNLDDKKIWSLFLEQDGTRTDEYTLSTIGDKNRTLPFFDYVNKWSREYVLTFHTSVTSSLTLQVANSDGKVKFSW